MTIKTNLENVSKHVETAAKGRHVKIIGVTKTVPSTKIEEAYNAGLTTFGENRIQEALPKIEALRSLQIEWHFIGHLQTNKAKDALRNFSCIQSVDSTRLLRQIEKEASKLKKKIHALLEVNLGAETTKHGFAPDQIQAALEEAKSLSWITVIGLMTIPPYLENSEEVRPYFRDLRQLLIEKQQEFPALVELSMGMSHDYTVAIEEGATMVRIGTALFGERL